MSRIAAVKYRATATQHQCEFSKQVAAKGTRERGLTTGRSKSTFVLSYGSMQNHFS